MNSECIICLENKIYITYTSCKHALCVDCLFHMKNMLCPMCRKDLSNELPLIVKDNILNNLSKNDKVNISNLQLNDQYEFPPLT